MARTSASPSWGRRTPPPSCSLPRCLAGWGPTSRSAGTSRRLSRHRCQRSLPIRRAVGTDPGLSTLNTRVLHYSSQGGLPMTAQAAMPLSVSAPVPMPTGSIEAYIQTVNRFPILSFEEEQRLARQFRNENDLDAARQLVLSHLRLVVALARGYLGYVMPPAELIQVGNFGQMTT